MSDRLAAGSPVAGPGHRAPKECLPGGFGAFTPQAFLKASRPFSPDGVDQAKKSWKPIERDADGVPTVLRCTGSPTGYLKTRQTYKEFRLSFQ